MTTLDATGVVVLIPAKDSAETIGGTVRSAREIAGVERVLVIDDGSTDATGDQATLAGADVLVLPRNIGKAGAVMAGVSAVPHATVYLMIDADVGTSAGAAGVLLGPVLDDSADMTIGVLPSAGTLGGFGLVRNLAAAGIERACGFRPEAPLSGQRAIRGELLRSLPLAPRFGLETALTIDAVRKGARVLEMPVVMDHRHTGRRWEGFRHRGRQGVDIVRALWPRLTGERSRMALIGLVTLSMLTWSLWSGGRFEPAGSELPTRPSKVLLFGVPRLGLDDLAKGDTPVLDGLVARGALAAMSVRTLSGRPSTVEGYATLNAGTRVRAGIGGASAHSTDDLLEGGTARDVSERRTGKPTGDAEVVVVDYPAIVRQISRAHLSSEPGALGDALHLAGKRTAVIGNADFGNMVLDEEVHRPVGVSLIDRSGSVDVGKVDADLLEHAVGAPFGVRFDRERMIAAFEAALDDADVIAVDPGDMDRAVGYRGISLDKPAQEHRENAIRRTDALLGDMLELVPQDTLVLVVSVSPPTPGWHLTPFIAAAPGIKPGYAHSPSVKRPAVVTVTDIAPTILEALGAEVPTGMIGHALRYRADEADLERLERLDRDAGFREGIYFRIAMAFIIVQALLYLVVMTNLTHPPGRRTVAVLRALVVAVAGFPLATFLFRAVPEVAVLGDGAIVVLLAIDALIAAWALRAKRHALSPLAWVTGATAALIILDVATGARLQYSSFLGYSLHTAARFFGIGNTAFATLGACAVIAACLHVQHAPRRREAVFTAGCFLGVVVLIDGAPSLGNDVGGILTLVPVFGLTLVALTGHRLSARHILIAGSSAALLLAVATGIDLLREPEARTHLGRFAADLFGGEDTAGTTISRKLATNLRVLGSSIWAWMVPIAAVFMLYVLVHLGRGEELLPRGSARRVGVIATISAGLLGFAVNDSGVVVTALVFVYLGPFLTLIALHREGEPVLVVSDR